MSQNDYKKIYIQESDELLQQMNSGLLALEKDSANSDALNGIFRSAHTLKSMSASMGYRPIAELSHKMEDLLGNLRSGETSVSDLITDALFKSFDCLERMVIAVQGDKEINTDIKPFLDLLESFIARSPKFSEDWITQDITLNVFEKNVLERVEKGGFNGYQINIQLEKSCVLKSVRAFMVFRNLHSIGEVIKSIPDMDSIQEEKFDLKFSCIFISQSFANEIKKNVMEIMEVENVEVKEITLHEIKVALPLKDSYSSGAQPAEKERHRKIQSIRVDVERLDKLMNLVEELAISRLRLNEIIGKMNNPDLKIITEGLGRLTDELQNQVMQSRLVPVAQVFERFPRLVRDVAKATGKKIKFEMTGGDIELDRTVLDEIGDPLIHMLKNAVDHGIEDAAARQKSGKPEEGTIVLSARREKSHVFIEVEDDGCGMNVEDIKRKAIQSGLLTSEAAAFMKDDEVLLLTAHPGFSTKKEVSEVSGRGVGLDVAKNKAESLGGALVIESEPGKGSRIILRLPVTTAVVQALLIKISDRVFAIPISNVIEILSAATDEIKKIENTETLLHRGTVLPLVRPFQTADHRPQTADLKMKVVVVEFGNKQFGIVVDSLMSQQDIVIKQITKELKGVRGFAGATILGDGKVALVLDVATLI